MWPNDRFIKLAGIHLPIIQAPMAGSALSDIVVAVSEAGGLGSLACALLSVEQARNELKTIRRKTSRPINANFFCHQLRELLRSDDPTMWPSQIGRPPRRCPNRTPVARRLRGDVRVLTDRAARYLGILGLVRRRKKSAAGEAAAARHQSHARPARAARSPCHSVV